MSLPSPGIVWPVRLPFGPRSPLGPAQSVAVLAWPGAVGAERRRKSPHCDAAKRKESTNTPLVKISVVFKLHDSRRDIHKAGAECRVAQVRVAIGGNSPTVGRLELRGAEP